MNIWQNEKKLIGKGAMGTFFYTAVAKSVIYMHLWKNVFAKLLLN